MLNGGSVVVGLIVDGIWLVKLNCVSEVDGLVVVGAWLVKLNSGSVGLMFANRIWKLWISLCVVCFWCLVGHVKQWISSCWTGC